jgi:drug/metabolite transporter (DMT)-like permease
MLARSPANAEAAAVWTSALLAAGSAVFYSSNVIANKLIVGSFSPSEAMFWHGVVATPLLAALVPRGAWSALSPHATAFLGMIAIGPGAFAGLAYVWGLRRMPAAHASTLTLVEPFVAVLLGAIVYGEPFGARTLIGGLLILGGSLAVMTSPSNEGD